MAIPLKNRPYIVPFTILAHEPLRVTDFIDSRTQHQEPVLWIVAAAVRQRSDCNLTSASFWNSQISHYVIATRASIELGQRGAVSLQDSCCVAS